MVVVAREDHVRAASCWRGSCQAAAQLLSASRGGYHSHPLDLITMTFTSRHALLLPSSLHLNYPGRRRDGATLVLKGSCHHQGYNRKPPLCPAWQRVSLILWTGPVVMAALPRLTRPELPSGKLRYIYPQVCPVCPVLRLSAPPFVLFIFLVILHVGSLGTRPFHFSRPEQT